MNWNTFKRNEELAKPSCENNEEMAKPSSDLEVCDNNYSEYQTLPAFSDYEMDSEVVTTLATVNACVTAISDISHNVKDMVQICQETKYKIALLDRQLEAYIVNSHENLEKYKATIPMLENSLRGISSRIDRLTDSIIASSLGHHTAEELQQQKMLLDLLQDANNRFDNMIMKIVLR